MTSLSDYRKNCQFVLDNVLDEQARIIERNEDRIIKLNTSQFEDGTGSDGKILKNTNPKFDGTYSLSTNLLNPNKRAGDLYNFFETGDFLRGMQADLTPDLSKINIFSTGTGSGDKSIFFAGYTNLFGLDKTNSDVLNYDIILPEILTFIHRYL